MFSINSLHITHIGPVKQIKSALNCDYFLIHQFKHAFWVLKRDGSFKYPQHTFWLRNKKNNSQLCTLIWGLDSYILSNFAFFFRKILSGIKPSQCQKFGSRPDPMGWFVICEIEFSHIWVKTAEILIWCERIIILAHQIGISVVFTHVRYFYLSHPYQP